MLLDGVRAGLDSVLLASERVRSQRRVGVLTIAAPAAFATWWLVPRLGRFASLHSDIEVRIAAMDGREPDLSRDGVDVAVVKRPAKLADRDRVEMPLLREIVFPVCAPSILDSGVPLRSLHDLVRHTLIESDTAEADDTEFTWSNWLSRFSIQQEQMPRQLRFSHFGLALSAAIDGLGVALGRSPMVDAELASGRLVRPFGRKVMAKASDIFALAWRDTGAGAPDQRIAAFRDFALDEACGCELAAGPCGMPVSERDTRTRAAWMAGRAARRVMVMSRP
ncbi:MAG: LysR substrate-binding domain-containing protein [Stellaceae bacterium]